MVLTVVVTELIVVAVAVVSAAAVLPVVAGCRPWCWR